MKIKAAEQIGMKASCLKLGRDTSQTELLSHVRELNDDPEVHGIIVQMPLDTSQSIDSHLITNSVHPDKDVDGLTTINEGKIATGDMDNGFLPCTPHGCLKLIEKSGVQVTKLQCQVAETVQLFLDCWLHRSCNWPQQDCWDSCV